LFVVGGGVAVALVVAVVVNVIVELNRKSVPEKEGKGRVEKDGNVVSEAGSNRKRIGLIEEEEKGDQEEEILNKWPLKASNNRTGIEDK